ncbi:MAG: hypothetical protein OSB00_18310, partial [Sphingomonas bacterium]|nr:hypothetical protein [Sphingomonas bacterium]
AFTPKNVIDFAAGLSGGKYKFGDDGLLTYDGKPVNVSADIANSEQYREAYHQRFGSYPPLTVDVRGGQVTPEAQSALEQKRDSFGGGIDAVVRGAADTASLGLADPLAAAVRSTFNGEGFGTNLVRERAVSAADEKVNPWLRLGGQAAGVVPSFTALSRLGATFAPASPYFGAAVTDTAGGAVYGGASNMEKDPIAGALIGGSTALIGNQVGQRLVAPLVERALSSATGKIDPIVRALTNRSTNADTTVARALLNDAQRLDLPMSLADADPKFRAVAGSATRLAPAGREYDEQVIEPRGRAQAERAISGIERDFGPTVDVGRTADDLVSQGRTAASPLYEQAYAAPVVATPEIDTLLNTPAGRAALARAKTIAANERRDPQSMGFALDHEGNVALNPVNLDAFQKQAEAKSAFDAAQEAHRVAMRTAGADTNATRDAVVQSRANMQDATAALAARPAEGAAATQRGYTTQTLDYVKRGLDDILEERRDKVTGRLNLDEYLRSVNQVRGQLVNEVDRLNPGYRTARQAYQGPAREKDALVSGYGAVSTRMKPDSMSRIVERLPSNELGQFQSGYRTGMAEHVEGMRLSSDPYAAVWGTPDQMAKAEMLFPDGVSNFSRQAELEKLMAKTQHETLGGSPTAGRRAADEQFAPGLGVQLAGEAALGTLTGTPPISAVTRAIRATAGDRFRMGIGGSKKAASIAELLLEPDPSKGLTTIDAMIAQQLLRSQSRAIGGSVGAAATVPMLGAK